MEARQHTDRHYEAELKELHLKILEMGGFGEKQIVNAVAALVSRDDALARQTIERDHTMNRMDVEVDELCLRLLALHQPAARRTVVCPPDENLTMIASARSGKDGRDTAESKDGLPSARG